MRSQINGSTFLAVTFILLIIVEKAKLSEFSTHENAKKLSRIKIRGKHFVDDQDRVVLFRGTNAVMKSFPWIPNQKFNDMTNLTQVVNLSKWGFNVVRLGLMWSGLMPERDVINQTYLNEMVNIIDQLGSFGIYVIIDLHQDMLSSKFNSYDGVPLWLINSMPPSRSKFPSPLLNQVISLSVFAAYLTESCGFAFQCLYENRNNFSDYFELYWSIVAKTFSEKTNILGYELINEPWVGNFYANPLLLFPSVAGQCNLMPLYDRAYNAIRKYDNDTLVFYEPITWGLWIELDFFRTGFTRPPANDPQRTVLSWHYYCWLLQLSKNPLINGTYLFYERVFCDGFQLEASFGSVRIDVSKFGNGGPSFLTEFGICAFPTDPDNPNSRLNTEECEYILDTSDRYFESWCYWDSNFYDTQTLEIIPDIVNVFSRVYPIAINGIPQSLRFNVTSKEFIFKYKHIAKSFYDAKLFTEIFIPPHVYPHGFEVRLLHNLNWSYDRENNRVLVTLANEIIQEFLRKTDFEFQEDVIITILPVLA